MYRGGQYTRPTEGKLTERLSDDQAFEPVYGDDFSDNITEMSYEEFVKEREKDWGDQICIIAIAAIAAIGHLAARGIHRAAADEVERVALRQFNADTGARLSAGIGACAGQRLARRGACKQKRSTLRHTRTAMCYFGRKDTIKVRHERMKSKNDGWTGEIGLIFTQKSPASVC
jgi:hypothetical protein